MGRQTVKPRLDMLNFADEHFLDHRTFLERYDRAYLPREALRSYLMRLLTTGSTKVTGDQYLAEELASLAVFDEYKAESSWRMLTGTERPRRLYSPGQEGTFLQTLLALFAHAGYRHLVLLVDEFEGLLVGGRLSRKQVSEYLVSLRHMIDATWQNLPMMFLFACPPEQWTIISRDLYPAGADRMVTSDIAEFIIPTLEVDDARRLLAQMIEPAVIGEQGEDDVIEPQAVEAIPPHMRNTPRALIRTFHALTERAASDGEQKITKHMVALLTGDARA